MARTAGARNRDYDEKRRALLETLTDFVLNEEETSPSFRQFSIACASSEPTLRHYFVDRSGLVHEIIRNIGHRCAPFRARLRQAFPSLDLALQDYSSLAMDMACDPMLVQAHLFALRESLTETAVFQTYIEAVVEPNIEALAERLVSSPGGPQDASIARTAAAMVTTNASMVAFRKTLLGSNDEAAFDARERLRLTTYWMVRGLMQDPDGSGLSAQAA